MAAWIALILGFSCGTASAQTTNQLWQQIGTVFVIAMENHNWTQPNPTASPQQLKDNPAAPYLNSLVTPGHSNSIQVSYATRYYNAGLGVHPSEPNYVWAEAGTTFGILTDNDPGSSSSNIFNAPHLARQLNAAGIPWKNYQEDVQFSSRPTISASGSSPTPNPYNQSYAYAYVVRHNPMAFFSDTQTQNVFPLTQLLADLTNNAVGRYNWITPNLYNDMHSELPSGFIYHGIAYTNDQAAVAQGDNFLSLVVPQIMASRAYRENGVIIIWGDETIGSDGTNAAVPEIIISPLSKGNAYASEVVLSHSSDLRTMEEIFGLGFVTNTIPAAETAATGGYYAVTNVNDLGDLFLMLPTVQIESLTNSSQVFVISWPTNAAAFNLQQSSALASGTWLDVTNSPVVVGDREQVMITSVTNATFFRLKYP